MSKVPLINQRTLNGLNQIPYEMQYLSLLSQGMRFDPKYLMIHAKLNLHLDMEKKAKMMISLMEEYRRANNQFVLYKIDVVKHEHYVVATLTYLNIEYKFNQRNYTYTVSFPKKPPVPVESIIKEFLELTLLHEGELKMVLPNYGVFLSFVQIKELHSFTIQLDALFCIPEFSVELANINPPNKITYPNENSIRLYFEY